MKKIVSIVGLFVLLASSICYAGMKEDADAMKIQAIGTTGNGGNKAIALTAKSTAETAESTKETALTNWSAKETTAKNDSHYNQSYTQHLSVFLDSAYEYKNNSTYGGDHYSAVGYQSFSQGGQAVTTGNSAINQGNSAYSSGNYYQALQYYTNANNAYINANTCYGSAKTAYDNATNSYNAGADNFVTWYTVSNPHDLEDHPTNP